MVRSQNVLLAVGHALVGGSVESSTSVLSDRVDITSQLHQQLRDVEQILLLVLGRVPEIGTASPRGHVQGSSSVVCRDERIRAAGDERADGLDMAARCGKK